MNQFDAKYISLKEKKLRQVINNEKTVVTVALELQVYRQSIHKRL